ncbi:MAG: hypothetical protein ACI8T1_003048 [Verrucomicrobiales bacterium]|jgi:hypothetical protein
MRPPNFVLSCLGALAFTACFCCFSAESQVVINEVDADQTSSDAAEFVELYDGGAGNTSLDGHLLVLYNGSDDASYRAFDLTGQVTNAQGYFVVGNPGVPNVGLEFPPGASGAIQNGPDAVALYNMGSVDDFPNDTPITQVGLIDAVVYTNDDRDSDDFELLDGLTPGELQILDTTTESMSRIPDGGAPFSSAIYALQAPTPGFANVITESLSLTLSANEISESAGADAVEVTIARSGANANEATITLTLADFTEATAPMEVTIPATQSETTFFIQTINDAWQDGTQSLALIAASPGLMDAQASLSILDDDNDPLGMVVNEVYADDQDDANGDNVFDEPGKDEFIELVNGTDAAIDLSNHTLQDAVAIRHRFPEGTTIEPGCAIVVFGGGNVEEGNNPLFGGATVQKANESNEFGLGLNNSGDFVRILNPDGAEVAGFQYDLANGDDGSLVRNPDVAGEFTTHFEVDGGPALFTFTPGFTVFGDPFCEIMLGFTLVVEPNMISEDAGENASVLTLTRTGPTDGAVTVTLTNGDPSEITLPKSVEIPIGIDSVEVPIHAVDDPSQDGDIVLTITASAPDFLNGSVQIQVLDDGDPPATVVINELDSDQPGDEDGEFVELYDGGVGNLSLDGFLIVLFNGNGGESYAAYELTGQSTNPEGFFVIGDPGVPNIGLAINNFTLQNGADGVALYRGFRSDFPTGSFPREDDLVDAVIYGTNDDDALDLIDTLAPDQPQANEGSSNNEDSIGRSPDGGEPRVTTTYIPLTPTPGAANGTAPRESYALWATGFESLGQPEDDPDNDGLANVLEYALRSDPLTPMLSVPFTVSLVDTDSVEIAIPLESAFPNDAAITFERSSDLSSWDTITDLNGQLADGMFRLRFSETLTNPQSSFIRIVATIAP